jgi:5-oxoprolinase (ATP-hydrolysing)
MKSDEKDVHLKLCIDTGGTFTDCIGVLPDGTFVRCKVLSNSTIRGSAQILDDQHTIKIDTGYSVKNNFYKGYDLSFTGKPKSKYRIISSVGTDNSLELEQRVPFEPGTFLPAIIHSNEEAPVFAARLLTDTSPDDQFPPLNMRLSTTKGTNSLLERNGGKTLFLVTEGFADLLKIRNQQRPELFTLNIRKPIPFYSKIVEVNERLDAGGKVIKPLDAENLSELLKPLVKDIDAAAVCFMHAYKNPEHEQLAASVLKDLGVLRVSTSSGLSSSIKMVPRAITADINAFLAPVMESYLENILSTIGKSSLKVMTSAGTLAASESYKPVDGLLSGPAGGVIGAAAIGNRNGFRKIISFDMGGTSTDVSRYDGEMDRIYEHRVGDAVLSAPAVDIETVAAGGGSICRFDGVSLTVGPESAGADPGPACYGLGGPLTLTDVNLLSGRLSPGNFKISIRLDAAESALNRVMQEVNSDRAEPLTEKEVLEGFLDIANERMAQAIRSISVQKGFDPAEYTLVAFGGAGAQHALSVAGKLGMKSVLIPADAGLLSAYGLNRAQREEYAMSQDLTSLDEIEGDLERCFEKLEFEAFNKLSDQGVGREKIDLAHRLIFMRFSGQDNSLQIEWKQDADTDLMSLFRNEYSRQYGHWPEARNVEVEALRVIAREKESGEGDESVYKHVTDEPVQTAEPSALDEKGGFSVFQSGQFDEGAKVSGPALILDPFSTSVIESGWSAELQADKTWIVKKTVPDEEDIAGERSTEVNLQLYTNRFRSLADQMGEMLRKTALSVNVKERLDYSCALLDSDGYLVVNAPHIPVHLGAMGTCVRSLIRALKNEPGGFLHARDDSKELKEGDILITNHPGYGGSHLPDVTIVTPVFHNGDRIGFVASRAHHAEIGGSRPGSMPPDATRLSDEGVVIPPAFLSQSGTFYWSEIRNLLENSRRPSRSIMENIADIEAAVAANHRGVVELKNLADRFGGSELKEYMQRIRKYASIRLKSALQKLDPGIYRAEERLDDGSLLKIVCTLSGSDLTVDFTGTEGVNPGNLNANPSIVNSVLMYVLRLIVDEPLPLNDGLLDPVKVILPVCILNPDFPSDPDLCPAVVGGNTETSQRLTDTLLKAFGMAACSYGTMNNVLFGNEKFGYYETVAGGTGAGEGFDGADGVHQHMTNTRAADPEILEHRYPVRLDKYAIREYSGGSGKWKGGDGLIREMTFLEPISLSVLTQHRLVAPYGLKGGENGQTGSQRVEFRSGKRLQMKWRDGEELRTGDRFILHTPGGGGFGKVK